MNIIKFSALRLEEAFQSLTDKAKATMRPVLDLLLNNPTAPASSKLSLHGAFEGGLVVHTWRVYDLLVRQAKAFAEAIQAQQDDQYLVPPYIQGDVIKLSQQLSSLNHDSLFKVAVCHDLNKLRTVSGAPYYVPNMIKNGTVRSDKVPWERHAESGSPLGTINGLRKKLALVSPDPTTEAIFDGLLQDKGVSIRDGVISLAIAASVSPTFRQELTAEEEFAIIYHDGAYVGRTGLVDEPPLQILLHSADMLSSRVLC